MADGKLHPVLRHLRRLIDPPGACSVPDADLLQRFVRSRDEAAFELLLWRHERLVLNVCRRVLHDSADAEDAFQATFLVLARKAGSIGHGQALAGWLHKVAYRVALRARAAATRRGRREQTGLDLDAVLGRDETALPSAWRELRPLLDQEVSRLPERYRVPVILCYLQGKTYDEIARQLGCSRGTVGTWLARARDLLRQRLTRRGLVVSAAVLAAVLVEQAPGAAAPAVLVESTLAVALRYAGGPAAATGLVSAPVAALTEGVLKAMFVTRIKIAAAAVLALVLLGAGVGVVGHTALAARDGDVKQENRSGATGERVTEPPPVNKEPLPQAGKAPDAPPNESGWQERTTLQGHTGHVMTVVFSPDAKQLVTGSLDGSVRTWDVALGKEIRRMQAGPGEAVSAVAFTPDGKILATGGGQRGKAGVVRLIDVNTGNIVRTLEGPSDMVFAVTVSPDGRMAVAGGRDGMATAWDLATGKRLMDIKTKAGTLFSLTLSPDGRLLASAGGEEVVREGNKAGELKVWDLATGKEIREFKDGTDTVTSVAFSPDGKLLASGNVDKGVRLWDAATGKIIARMDGHEKTVRAVAFSPDGRLLATGGFDGKVQLWDVPTGRLLATLKAKAVLSLAFSPDGRMLAAGTGEGGGEVKVWERKQPQAAVVRPNKEVSVGGFDELKIILDKSASLAEGKDRLDQLVQELVKGKRSDEQVTEALCLATLSRLPTDGEKKFVADYLAKAKDRQDALMNILWVFTNSKEFGVNVEALRKREKH